MRNFIVGIVLVLLLNVDSVQASSRDALPINIIKPTSDRSDKMIVFITGDGGWNEFSQQLASTFSVQGMPVIALNSLKYFWKKKSPQDVVNDLTGLMNKYSNEWQKKKIVLCGYSFGADVLPFIYSRLPESLKDKVVLLQMLSPASYTDFEIHVADLFGAKDPVRSMNIASELKRVDTPVLCYYGNLEEEKPLANQQKQGYKVILLPGDHHYRNSFSEIARAASGK